MKEEHLWLRFRVWLSVCEKEATAATSVGALLVSIAFGSHLHVVGDQVMGAMLLFALCASSVSGLGFEASRVQGCFWCCASSFYHVRAFKRACGLP